MAGWLGHPQMGTSIEFVVIVYHEDYPEDDPDVSNASHESWCPLVSICFRNSMNQLSQHKSTISTINPHLFVDWIPIRIYQPRGDTTACSEVAGDHHCTASRWKFTSYFGCADGFNGALVAPTALSETSSFRWMVDVYILGNLFGGIMGICKWV